MFVGHFAAGLAAKKVEPGLSLGATFVACQALDLIWPVLVLADVERVAVDPTATAFTPLDFEFYPWSHSLGMALCWSVLAVVVARLLRRSNAEAVLVGGLVASHWLLDWVTHRPDLPLWFGESRTGLGLWHSVPASLVVELALFGGGIWLYRRATGGRGGWGFWALIGFLLLVYLLNVFGPTPPVDTPPAAIAGPALAMWLVVAWGYWVDRPGAGTGPG